MFEAARRFIRAVADALSTRQIRRTTWDTRRTTIDSITPATISGALSSAANGDMRSLADVYDLMPATDSHLRGVRRQLKAGVVAMPWELAAADDSPDAARALELVKAAVENPGVPFAPLLEALIEGELRGLGAVEILWPEPAGGLRVWSGFAAVPMQRLRLDRDTGAMRVIVDPSKPLGEPVASFPRGKFATIIADGDVPDFSARGTYRAILQDWYGRLNARYWLLQTLERFGMPVPVGHYRSDTDRQILEAAFASFGAAGSLIVSEGTTVDLSSLPAQTKLLHEDYLEASARRISVALLGAEQTATVGTDQGSKASAGVHAMVRKDVLYALWQRIGDVVRRDVFVPYLELNAGPAIGQKAPLIAPQFDDPADMATTAAAIQVLVDLGLPIGVNYVRETLGVPEPEKGEARLRSSLAPVMPFGQTAPAVPLGLPKPADTATEEAVQTQALTGAQMASLQQIVQSVADGLLPLDSAVQLVMLSIPSVSEAQARALVAPAASFTPTPAEPSPRPQQPESPSTPTPPPKMPLKSRRQRAVAEEADQEATDEARGKYASLLRSVRTAADLRELRDKLASTESEPAPDLVDSLAAVQLEAFLEAVAKARKAREEAA